MPTLRARWKRRSLRLVGLWLQHRIATVGFVCFVLVVGWLLYQQRVQADATDKLVAQNRELILRQQRLGEDARQNARRTDILICQRFNKILRADRATLAAAPKRTAVTLQALGLTPAQIAVYERRQMAQLRIELERRPLLAGGDCSKLPNPNGD